MLADLQRLAEPISGLWAMETNAVVDPRRYRRTLDHAVAELYRPAQLDVMRRIHVLRAEQDRT